MWWWLSCTVLYYPSSIHNGTHYGRTVLAQDEYPVGCFPCFKHQSPQKCVQIHSKLRQDNHLTRYLVHTR